MAKYKSLKVENNAELLSFIINETPELKAEIDLPVQGEGTAKYGEIIMNNERYKNAFINTINLIGLTVIKRNEWENPWESFANRGTLRYGQQIREIIQDLAKVFDYNKEYNNKTKFLETAVPDVYNYIHEINFQKVYETTINEARLRMAFDSEDGLIDFVVDTIANLYETYKYDKYQVDKYQLARRIINGTVTTVQIPNYDDLTPRQILTKIKSYSNKMTFKSPNYNPAGVRRATRHQEQIVLLDTEQEAEMTTDVLATSYFRNEAELKTNLALIDGFGNFDDARLTELLGEDFVPFTETELEQLNNAVGMIISDKWFMDYYYSLDSANTDGKRQVEFVNPTTLERNIFLHAQLVISTSPFENAIIFTKDAPTVTSVVVSPEESSVSAGLSVDLNAVVTTTGFANKSVIWSVEEAPGETTGKVTVDGKGHVIIPSDYTHTSTEEANPIVIRATSVYDNTKYGDASISVL